MQAHQYWQVVGSHDDSLSAIMRDRRSRIEVNKPITGLDSYGLIITSEQEEPLLAIGPAGSGKTASAIVVNSLLAPAALVTTSTRNDVYLATALARARLGRVWCFSARGNGLPGALELRWSPLQGCENFEYAQEAAKRLADYRDQGASARGGDEVTG